MNSIKAIRDRLKLTQAALADGMGCTQGNIWHYEQGQTVPPEAAKRLIAFAQTLGHTVTFDDIYSAPKIVSRADGYVGPDTRKRMRKNAKVV
jgi:putative transcriptional regulator